MTDLSITDLVKRLQRLERKHFGNAGPGAVSGKATGVDVVQNGETVVEQATAVHVGANASAKDNGDGTATVDTTDTDTNTQATQQVCKVQAPAGLDFNTGTATRLDLSSVPITDSAFTVDTTNDVITLEESGKYEINASFRGRHTGSYTDRILPRLDTRNGDGSAVPGGSSSGGYVRNANNAHESSLSFTAVIDVTAPHDIYFEHSTGNGTGSYDWSIWTEWSALTVKKLTA